MGSLGKAWGQEAGHRQGEGDQQTEESLAESLDDEANFSYQENPARGIWLASCSQGGSDEN